MHPCGHSSRSAFVALVSIVPSPPRCCLTIDRPVMIPRPEGGRNGRILGGAGLRFAGDTIPAGTVAACLAFRSASSTAFRQQGSKQEFPTGRRRSDRGGTFHPCGLKFDVLGSASMRATRSDNVGPLSDSRVSYSLQNRAAETLPFNAARAWPRQSRLCHPAAPSICPVFRLFWAVGATFAPFAEPAFGRFLAVYLTVFFSPVFAVWRGAVRKYLNHGFSSRGTGGDTGVQCARLTAGPSFQTAIEPLGVKSPKNGLFPR